MTFCLLKPVSRIFLILFVKAEDPMYCMLVIVENSCLIRVGENGQGGPKLAPAKFF